MKNNIRIMDLPQNERPREKLVRYGPESLTNSELLAIILRSGTSKENILTLCNRILMYSKGLNGLINLNLQELTEIKGIKIAKGSQILALIELYKRLNSYRSGEEYKINSPKDIVNLMMDDMRHLKKEELRAILLNTKNVVIAVKVISQGSLNSSIVHPREVFKEAIKVSSASLVICHNHPSGDPTPSKEDINITKRLRECGKLLGIDLLDHIIIGDGQYISLKEKGLGI